MSGVHTGPVADCEWVAGGGEDGKWEGNITWIQILDGKEGKMVDVKGEREKLERRDGNGAYEIELNVI